MSDMIEQYKAYLQDLGNLGGRHETARGFYIAVISALLSFMALAGKEGPLRSISEPLIVIIGVGGVAISALWLFHTLAFAALYSAKFGRLQAMERQLPFQNFDAEYSALSSDRRYRPLTTIECAVAAIFGGLFLVAMFLG